PSRQPAAFAQKRATAGARAARALPGHHRGHLETCARGAKVARTLADGDSDFTNRPGGGSCLRIGYLAPHSARRFRYNLVERLAYGLRPARYLRIRCQTKEFLARRAKSFSFAVCCERTDSSARAGLSRQAS